MLHCRMVQPAAKQLWSFVGSASVGEMVVAFLVKARASRTTLCLKSRPCAAGEPEAAPLPAVGSAPGPGPSSSSQPAGAPARSSSITASGARLEQPPGAQQAPAPPAPLQLMHNVLSDAACKLLLHELHQDFRRLREEGPWKDKLKLNASSVLGGGIRSGGLSTTWLSAGQARGSG